MRVLVTGGAGFLGINMIRTLMEKGVEEIVSLDVVPFDYPEKDKISVFTGDIRDDKTCAKAMKSVDQVIHCAAALPLYAKEDIFSTDVEGTAGLLAAAKQEGVKRFVHISSTAVYGIPDHHPLCEDDKLEGVGPYGEAKILAEEECLKSRNEGMCVPILRPKSFIGPERLGVFALLYDWAQDGRHFPMIGSGRNRYQLLDVADLCEAVWLAMTGEETAVNDTFNIGAEEFKTMKEDYQIVLDAAGFGKKIVPFPAWPAIMGLRFLELLQLSPLYKWVYETASKDSFVSIEKAKTKLGYAPRYSNQDALLRNYRWYMDNRERFTGQGGVSHRVPWKQGILGLIKYLF